MPVVMCSFCQYLGRAKVRYKDCSPESDDLWDDVEEHEKNCSERPRGEDVSSD